MGKYEAHEEGRIDARPAITAGILTGLGLACNLKWPQSATLHIGPTQGPRSGRPEVAVVECPLLAVMQVLPRMPADFDGVQLISFHPESAQD